MFNVPGCVEGNQTYVNTVVFTTERRPEGGVWRSFAVRCGVEAPFKEGPVQSDLESLVG